MSDDSSLENIDHTQLHRKKKKHRSEFKKKDSGFWAKNNTKINKSFKKEPKNTPLPTEQKILVDNSVRPFLKRIGLPEASPLIPDSFQIKASEYIKKYDVIVSAPTGSGKTWIAAQALKFGLLAGERAWYASPLKALSNSKFLEFGRQFGEDRVGLLTGDLKINTDAAIIVGTTEILRNQLYDAMAQKTELPFDLVILDEAHYLGDPDRGVVWEETLIYMPSRVRLLLLSATIDNAQELAAWLEKKRGQKVRVVMGGERPVPLIPLCLDRGTLNTLSLSVSKHVKKKKSWQEYSGKNERFNAQIILSALEKLDLNPSIFFLKSRALCDQAVSTIFKDLGESPEKMARRNSVIDNFLERYPFLSNHEQMKRLRQSGVASHHAGHLPYYKMLVEELMSQGLLSAIFATSTVSAGVNFPARTVVIPQSDRFNGMGFSPLTATELAQMTGRAGRRGRDLIGFAILLPGQFMNLKFMDALFTSPPEPIRSRLTINFPMVLNLLNSHELMDIRVLLNSSLAAWQSTTRHTKSNLEKAMNSIWEIFLKHLNFLKKIKLVDSDNRLTEDGLMATDLRLDHPLIFYEGLLHNAWPDSPDVLAGVIAALVSTKESRSSYDKRPPGHLLEAVFNFADAVKPMMKSLKSDGFEIPNIDINAAWAVWSWARYGDFKRASDIYGHGPGDLAMICLRVAEHLRQLSNLEFRGQKTLDEKARQARQQILKEPIIL